MGERVVFNFKQADGNYISLYSHWGETSMHEDLAHAIDKARPRWNDETYLARILVSQLIGQDWDSELGYGLWAGTSRYEGETNVEIDLSNKTVTDDSGTHSFDYFANYHREEVNV